MLNPGKLVGRPMPSKLGKSAGKKRTDKKKSKEHQQGLNKGEKTNQGREKPFDQVRCLRITEVRSKIAKIRN